MTAELKSLTLKPDLPYALFEIVHVAWHACASLGNGDSKQVAERLLSLRLDPK
jgi:hypothetical protein